MAKTCATFLPMTIILWLIAHSVALFSHEFAHSFSAAALGWKAHPLELEWGGSSAMNLLLQTDVDEHVDYPPIFDSGHGIEAGLIALAGCVLGNLCVSLFVGIALFAVARRRDKRALGMFAYWLIVMSVGNLISYVPLRVFTTHADMHTAQIGFGWTPVDVLIFVGVPFLAAILWFFLRFQTRALAWMFPHSFGRRVAAIVLTSLTVFGFFCLGGISGYGDTSHRLSVAFIVCFAPITACVGIIRTWRDGSTSRSPSTPRASMIS